MPVPMRIDATTGLWDSGRTTGRALVPVSSAPRSGSDQSRGDAPRRRPAQPGGNASVAAGPSTADRHAAPVLAQLIASHGETTRLRPRTATGEATRAYGAALKRAYRFEPGSLLARVC